MNFTEKEDVTQEAANYLVTEMLEDEFIGAGANHKNFLVVIERLYEYTPEQMENLLEALKGFKGA